MLTVRLVWPTSRFNPTLPRCTESEALLPLPHESHLSLMLDVLVSDTRSGSHRSDQSVPQCPQSKQLVWAAMRGRCRPGTRTEPTYTLTVFMMVYKSYIDPGHGLVWFWSFIQYGRLCFYLFNTKHSFFILITLFPEEGGCGRTRGQTSKSKTQNKTRKNLLWVSAAGGTLSSSLHFKLKRFYVSVFTRVKVLCMFSDVFLLLCSLEFLHKNIHGTWSRFLSFHTDSAFSDVLWAFYCCLASRAGTTEGVELDGNWI